MADFTQAQLDAINAAIASGALTVEYADKKVTYRSMDDLLKARAVVMKDLGQTNRTTRFFANHSKGLTGCD